MRIRSHAPWMWIGMAAAGLVTLAMMSIYVYLMHQDGRDRWFVYLFVTPFVLAGLLLTTFGLRALLRHLMHGSWTLEVPDGGGVLGSPIPATLFPRRERRPAGDLTCQMRCIRVIRNPQASANIQALWSRMWTVSAAVIQPATGLALELPIPDEGRATQMDLTASGVQWQLTVVVPSKTASGDAADQAVFDIPVRRAGRV